MTFIEVQINEDLPALEKLLREAYGSIYRVDLPSFRFGRVIVWQGRMFQALELSPDSTAFESEDRLFRTWRLPPGRARVQVGSIRGEVFTTPPEVDGEPAARIQEGGKCGREYVVRPFDYSDYDRTAYPGRCI
jgi:hypothetical protein